MYNIVLFCTIILYVAVTPFAKFLYLFKNVHAHTHTSYSLFQQSGEISNTIKIKYLQN